jgi:hypothetical protein
VTAAQAMIGSARLDGHVRSLVHVGGSTGRAAVGGSPLVDLWVWRCSMLVVAGVVAYSSYEHQRQFAGTGGLVRASMPPDGEVRRRRWLLEDPALAA